MPETRTIHSLSDMAAHEIQDFCSDIAKAGLEPKQKVMYWEEKPFQALKELVEINYPEKFNPDGFEFMGVTHYLSKSEPAEQEINGLPHRF